MVLMFYLFTLKSTIFPTCFLSCFVYVYMRVYWLLNLNKNHSKRNENNKLIHIQLHFDRWVKWNIWVRQKLWEETLFKYGYDNIHGEVLVYIYCSLDKLSNS